MKTELKEILKFSKKTSIDRRSRGNWKIHQSCRESWNATTRKCFLSRLCNQLHGRKLIYKSNNSKQSITYQKICSSKHSYGYRSVYFSATGIPQYELNPELSFETQSSLSKKMKLGLFLQAFTIKKPFK